MPPRAMTVESSMVATASVCVPFFLLLAPQLQGWDRIHAALCVLGRAVPGTSRDGCPAAPATLPTPIACLPTSCSGRATWATGQGVASGHQRAGASLAWTELRPENPLLAEAGDSRGSSHSQWSRFLGPMWKEHRMRSPASGPPGPHVLCPGALGTVIPMVIPMVAAPRPPQR